MTPLDGAGPLSGPVVVVGSSPGTGWELALGLGDRGAEVVFVPLGGPDGDQPSHPGSVGTVRWSAPWDGASGDSLVRAVTEADGSTLCAVVWAWAPAGSATPVPLSTLDETTWASLAEEPLTRFRNLLQGASVLFNDGAGAIVALVPTISLVGGPTGGLAAWATAGDGQRALVRIAARGWGRRGITVHSLAVTPDVWVGDGQGRTEPPTPPESPRLRPGLRPRSLLERPTVRHQVAGAVWSLTGPAWDGVTGATVAVDGGIWMAP